MIKLVVSTISLFCCINVFGQYSFKEHYFDRNRVDTSRNYLEFTANYLAGAIHFSNEFKSKIYNSGTFTTELKEKTIAGLTDVNTLGFGGLAGLVYKRKYENYNLRVGFSSQIISNNRLSKDLVKLALNGNAPYAGEQLNLGQTRVKVDAFNKLSVGLEKVVKENFLVGAAINLYQGMFHFDMELERGDFFTEQDGSEVRLDTKFDQAYSRPGENGYGAGLDLYLVSKREQTNFLLHVEDIGFIRYKNLTKFNTDSSFTFNGVEILDIFNSESGSIGSDETESVHKFFGIESDTSSKTVFTPAKVTLGVQSKVSNKLFIELYANYQFLAAYSPQVILRPNLFFLGDNFSFAPMVTLGGFGIIDYGLNLSYHHSKYFASLDLFEFEHLIARNSSSGRMSALKLGLLF